MAQKKRKETETIERNMKDKQRVWRKHEGRKRRKRKRQKTENGIWKVVKMEDTRMVKRKLVFCSQRNKQTNGMKKREKFCERKKENDERERGPVIKRTELRQRCFFSKKRIKTKGSKQGVEKTTKRHTLKRKTILTRRCSQKVCKQQKGRTNEREKTEKHRERKKKQEINKRSDKFWQRSSKNTWQKRKFEKEGFREEQKSNERSKKRAETRIVLRKKGRKKLEKKGTDETKQREERRSAKGFKERNKKEKWKTLS